MDPMLNTAIKAAHAAGDIIARSADRIDQLQIENKDRNDFVTEIDRSAEETIIGILRKAYPDHSFLGEESGEHKPNAEALEKVRKLNPGVEPTNYEWIIDPLDGTTNFLHGIPHFAVSIALKKDGKLDQAVIYDPMKDDMFHATRGGGAFLNNRRIRVSKRLSIENAVLATGIPFGSNQEEMMDTYLKTLKVLSLGAAGVRRFGAASLDLAYVAAGRYDGYWEFGLKEWDIAAGVLLVQEAGGLVGDLKGGSSHMQSGDVVASNPKVFKNMLKRLHGVLK